MHVRLTSDYHEDYGIEKDTVHEVLGRRFHNKDAILLIAVALGASRNTMGFEVLSTNYNAKDHERGEYGWIAPRHYELIEGSVTNASMSKLLLSPVED